MKSKRVQWPRCCDDAQRGRSLQYIIIYLSLKPTYNLCNWEITVEGRSRIGCLVYFSVHWKHSLEIEIIYLVHVTLFSEFSASLVSILYKGNDRLRSKKLTIKPKIIPVQWNSNVGLVKIKNKCRLRAASGCQCILRHLHNVFTLECEKVLF